MSVCRAVGGPLVKRCKELSRVVRVAFERTTPFSTSRNYDVKKH